MTSLRVLVVDDSAFARKVLRQSLTTERDLEVVGTAQDGLDALEKISELKPDVITLDLVMPQLDGLGVLRELRNQPTPPRVVVVSMADGNSELVLSALELGAVDFVHKPTALATDRLWELAAELATKVRLAGVAQASKAAAPAVPDLSEPSPFSPSQTLVVMGTSTGGPQALMQVLSRLPPGFPAPIAIALHIPPGYTEALAQRLNSKSALEVLEASDGLPLLPGRAVLARAGWHLKIDGESNHGAACLESTPADTPHRPSVDVLFQSAAKVRGPRVLGVVLTGMGNDGLEGARAIRAAGGRVVTEDASSCVIYGMPRCVEEAGLSQAHASLDALPELLVKLVTWEPRIST